MHALLVLSSCGGDDATVPAAVVTPTATLPTATVNSTINPLVARLTVANAPSGAKVVAQFGIDTSYARFSSEVTAASNGVADLLVAGMTPKTAYHIRAKITGLDGSIAFTPDATFTTGALPPALASLNLKAESMPGRTPAPGVEMIEPAGAPAYPYAVDLNGKLVWYYTWADYNPRLSIGGMQRLANGHFVAAFASQTDAPLTGVVDRDKGLVREFDLAGETVRQITVTELNQKLSARGFNLVLDQFHHHVEALPNGHWLILSNTTRIVDGTPMLGDVVVDLDDQLNPVFVWNAFDHLDPARHPFGKGDWTHANAVTYSPTDGNILLSMRHQNWVIKINYRSGAGDGAVLWRLGADGDFVLTNGRTPTDWQYAQHFPFFTGKNSAGIFNVLLMDNGDFRPDANGVACDTPGGTSCYTTVPEFRLDEQARTATIVSRATLPTALYSNFGGNAEILQNGNIEFTLSGIQSGGVIQEITPDDSHALVWSLKDLNSNFIYRGYRLSSLYPNVTWQ